jgi:Pyruvate/2-oxoacid:ferredoxin oxidoreductase delta subunit
MSMDDRYKEVTSTINTAGGTPFPETDTLVEIVKRLVDEDELDMIMAFKGQKSQTLDQLKESSGMAEDEILKKTKALADKGIIFDQPNRSGVVVFRLLPLVNVGVFEYTFMQKLERTDRNKELSALFTKMFEEMGDLVQKSYDGMVGFMKHMPAVDRTVPFRVNKATGKATIIEIEKDLGEQEERIIQSQDVFELIEKFEEIAVGHCFCRHHKDMEDRSCKQTDERENCFTFGKSARYTSDKGFMRMIDKAEARRILEKCRDDGLIHKAYHPNFDVEKPETSVCNCCKCCCGNSVENQIGPIVNAAGFLAGVDAELCTGCETCADYCHADAVKLGDDGVSHVDEERCLGCGACASFCPEGAVSLAESQRIVRIAPPRKG